MCESDFSTFLDAGAECSRCAATQLSLWLIAFSGCLSSLVVIFSHVDSVSGLVHPGVRCEVRVHLAHAIIFFMTLQARGALAVDDVLVVTLGLVV